MNSLKKIVLLPGLLVVAFVLHGMEPCQEEYTMSDLEDAVQKFQLDRVKEIEPYFRLNREEYEDLILLLCTTYPYELDVFPKRGTIPAIAKILERMMNEAELEWLKLCCVVKDKVEQT